MALSELENYIEDDWGDNALTSRTASDEGYFLHPSDNLLASGDVEAGDVLKGVYRPDWDSVSGNPSASSGILQLPIASSTDQIVQTKSRLVIGEWNVSFQYQSSVSNNTIDITLFGQTIDYSIGGSRPANSYFAQFRANGDHRLSRIREDGSVTDIISSNWAKDTTYHDLKVTRTAYGRFESFIDGASQGTSTDTEYVSGKYFVLGNHSDSECHFDKLVIK